MEEKISEIRTRLKETKDDKLAEFLERYYKDERSGVIALCAQAVKRMAAYEKELLRIEVMMRYEREYSAYGAICGIDEVGRGPLAGPVVAGAVILPKDCQILYLNDSKKLTAKMRDRLYDEIMEKAVATGIGFATEKRIDEINILNATYEAMRIPEVSIRQIPIIKGDAKSVSIAAASIIAKVTRDRYMEEMDKKYPGYGFASNKGYGSGEHIAALKQSGPCEIHRKSFIGHFVPV